MAFLHKYNYDDVFLRSLSVALLNLLTNKLFIWNRIADKDYRTIPIPFFYDMASSDERFMQDIYMGDSLDDCIPVKITEGNTDLVPRGAIRLTDININTASLTNRFVRGEYRQENDDGNLITHNAPINHIPLDIGFECKIVIDGELNAFKVVQQWIRTFIFTHRFMFLFDGFVIEAQTGFPESGGLERAFEHSYADDSTRTISFTLTVETYMPVIDKTLDYLKSQQMESFNSSIIAQNFIPSVKYSNGDSMYDIMIPNHNLETGKDKIFIPSDSNKILDV